MNHTPDPHDAELETALRAALRRTDLAPDFRTRLLHRMAAGPAPALQPRRRAWAALAVAAMLLLGAVRGLELRQRQQRRAGEAAKAQLLLALRITSQALQHTEAQAVAALPPAPHD